MSLRRQVSAGGRNRREQFVAHSVLYRRVVSQNSVADRSSKEEVALEVAEVWDGHSANIECCGVRANWCAF